MTGEPDDRPRMGQPAHQPTSSPAHQNPSNPNRPEHQHDLEGSHRSGTPVLGHGHIRPDTITHPISGRNVRIWWLGLPFTPADLPNLNRRDNWRSRAQLTRSWRGATNLMCRSARIPHLDRILVALYYTPAVQRRRDPDNLVAALKPAVDGLVDANVITDDTALFVRREMPIILPPAKLPDHAARLVLYIEELP